jgi:hypothetical protein
VRAAARAAVVAAAEIAEYTGEPVVRVAGSAAVRMAELAAERACPLRYNDTLRDLLPAEMYVRTGAGARSSAAE